MILQIRLVEQSFFIYININRYPFYSSEILGQENEKLINFLFDKPEDEMSEGINNPIEDDET